MEIKILTKNDSELYFPEILEMLKRADGEFVPPLSSRSSTTQSSLVGNASTPEGILLYFEEMKKQRLAVALENGELMAFMSYRENYLTDTVTEVPNVYLSTLIVKPEGRGKGLTQIMYGELFKAYPDRCVYTRKTAHRPPGHPDGYRDKEPAPAAQRPPFAVPSKVSSAFPCC